MASSRPAPAAESWPPPSERKQCANEACEIWPTFGGGIGNTQNGFFRPATWTNRCGGAGSGHRLPNNRPAAPGCRQAGRLAQTSAGSGASGPWPRFPCAQWRTRPHLRGIVQWLNLTMG
jgi:hypothetical protein